jgi:predicted  nucleic acid-binding Zn-ribbon protein
MYRRERPRALHRHAAAKLQGARPAFERLDRRHRRARPPRRHARARGAGAGGQSGRLPASQQRARDDDRREILNDELRSEERKLAELRRDFNNGEPERQGNEKNYAKYQERVLQMRDNIGRAEKNVDALKREIANIR